MSRRPRLTEQVHARLAAHLRGGDRAVDATAGNGHDTLFLARQVGGQGQVWAFDVQSQALAATRKRLQQAGLADRVNLVHAGHQALSRHLPATTLGQVKAVVFNLGYLPGGDHALITRPETTLAALNSAWEALAPAGVISLMIYRGHPGGAAEFDAVADWCRSRGIEPEAPDGPARSPKAPVWWLLTRCGTRDVQPDAGGAPAASSAG